MIPSQWGQGHLGDAQHEPLFLLGRHVSPAAPTGRCSTAGGDDVFQPSSTAVMLSSLERALTHPKKLRNPKVFTVPHSSPTRQISTSFLPKASSKAHILLHTHSSSLQDPREHYCWCTLFLIPKTHQHLSISYKCEEDKKTLQILGDT